MSRCGVAKREGDLPAALLQAVDDAVREGGASALSLRDVARRAGVSHAAPAHHFGSKAGLLTAFAVQGYRRLAQSVIEELGRVGPTDGPTTLAAVGRGYVRFAVSEPAEFEVMFRLDALEEGAPELVQATDAAYSLLSATIERCRLEGSLGNLDPMLVGVQRVVDRARAREPLDQRLARGPSRLDRHRPTRRRRLRTLRGFGTASSVT